MHSYKGRGKRNILHMGQDLFCLKIFDTFTSSVHELKMNVVAGGISNVNFFK